ncbi:MAG: thioesterase [Opitutaceae bacterium]|nr:thioesterase [Opitutaceae bacterium]
MNLDLSVAYGDVDRDGLLLLPGVFKFLQEAAIKHADQYDTGTHAMLTRGESWVLNRLAATIHRYPRYEEVVRVTTWSSGIRVFKGFRDFRVYARSELILEASSLWIYVDLKNKSLTRVPTEIAAAFPFHDGTVFRPNLEKLRLVPPGAGTTAAATVAIRYSDIDGNGHVNNTAYFDLLQTALVRSGFPARPKRIEIQFLREIPADVTAVDVCLERQDRAIVFSIGLPEAPFAVGQAG